MRCYPADGGPSIVLERERHGQAPLRMLLLRHEDEFLLRDSHRGTLAVASDLPALFDAVDAGLADETVPA
jgi:hypothetical protein